jgi:hypothetical protein
MFDTINNNIITVLGIDTLPVEQQKEAMERLGAIVYQEVMLRALDEMNDEDKDEFEKLIETNPDPEAMFTFLAAKVPTIDSIAAEEAEKLRSESTDIMGEIGK